MTFDSQQSRYCAYYQAHVERQRCWEFAACLRSFEHLAFDRTLDKDQSLFEFFVPENMEIIFLEVMDYFQKKQLISGFQKLPNRLID